MIFLPFNIPVFSRKATSDSYKMSEENKIPNPKFQISKNSKTRTFTLSAPDIYRVEVPNFSSL